MVDIPFKDTEQNWGKTTLTMFNRERPVLVDGKEALPVSQTTQDSMNFVELVSIIGVFARKNFPSFEPSIT